VAISEAQLEDARMVVELEKRNNTDAEWKAGVIRQRMLRRQSIALDRKIKISPQVCKCGNVVSELVSIYWMCDVCVTEHVANQEIASA
jgi:hypothetical protein